MNSKGHRDNVFAFVHPRGQVEKMPRGIRPRMAKTNKQFDKRFLFFWQTITDLNI
jgi:hypothetical protein